AAVEVPPVPIITDEFAPERALGAVAVKPESQAKLREALAFRGASDFPRRAIPLLREAVRLDATNDAAQFWLGAALLLAGEHVSAIAPLEEAVRLAPASRQYK